MDVVGYTAVGLIEIVRNGEHVFVPDDPENADRQEVAVWEGDGNTIPAYQPPAPDEDDINIERQRRIALPLTVTITGGGTFAADMSDQSRANIAGLTTLAMILSGQGQTTTMTTFRDADNVDHSVTPAQAIQIGVQAALHVDALYKKSWALKAMEPIPADYADDNRWQ